MEVKILGTGCAKCARLYQAAQRAIAEAGLDVTLEKVEDIPEIMKFGVMMTPALVIDGAVMAVGKVPKVAEIVAWMREMAAMG